jgi:hypothetical protein
MAALIASRRPGATVIRPYASFEPPDCGLRWVRRCSPYRQRERHSAAEQSEERVEMVQHRVFNTNSAQQLADNLVTLSPAFAKVRSSAYNSSDASLLKHIAIHEQVRLESRTDFLNIFNQVDFAAPNVTRTSSSFGIITAQR